MDIEEIRAKLYEDFDADGIIERQEKKKKQDSKEQLSPTVEPIDIYQRNQDRIYDVNQKAFPKGSSKAVEMSVYAVVDGVGAEGLGHAYHEAQEDIDTLKERGERGRAEVRRNQYMQEFFLPAVEIVVNSTSPDEVLNSKRALDTLDKYALVGGSGKGYTATYIRQAYGNQLGQQEGCSDASVRSDVMRINAMLDNGQIRTAVGIANNIKDKIDSGQAMADDIDYELIGRVVSFYK